MLNQSPENPEQLSHTTQEVVLDHLRGLILDGMLRPGERLVQSKLARQFGVSRTPIREALQNLASEGLVTLSPHKGASVANLSLSELEDVYDIRIAIEGRGAYLAAQNITDEDLEQLESLLHQMRELFRKGDRWRLLGINRQFYVVLYAIAERPRLYELIMRYLDLAALYRRMAFALDHHFSNTIVQHEDILGALRRRDPEVSQNLISIGLQQTADDLIAFLKDSEHVSGPRRAG